LSQIAFSPKAASLILVLLYRGGLNDNRITAIAIGVSFGVVGTIIVVVAIAAVVHKPFRKKVIPFSDRKKDEKLRQAMTVMRLPLEAEQDKFEA
jgi:nucleoside recognition membrane protein YjiH